MFLTNELLKNIFMRFEIILFLFCDFNFKYLVKREMLNLLNKLRNLSKYLIKKYSV